MEKIIKFLVVLIAIVVILIGVWSVTERLRFSYIVIHHSASEADNYRSIAEYHRKERGWREAAYHLILSNGSTGVPLGYLEATSRYRYLSNSVATKSGYHNLRGIHICVVGNYDVQEMPDRIKAALTDALLQLQEKYGIRDDRILFHRDCSASTCPGKFITKEKLKQWLASEPARCPDFLKKQHRRVIGRDWKIS